MRPSVIIPTYNRPEQLRKVLYCLSRQSNCAIHEVIVCDDGSTMRLDGVLERFAEILPLKYEHQEDLGFRAAAARNLGIRRATGDILILIDDDILCPDDFVAAHLAAHRQRRGTPKGRIVLGLRRRLSKMPASLPISKRELKACEPEERWRDPPLLWRLWPPRRPRLLKGPHPWKFVVSCNMSVSRTDDKLLFDEAFEGWGGEDQDLGYRLFRAGYEIVVAPGATGAHIEDPRPRDPARCETLGLEPQYESYVRNCVRLIRKHSLDVELVSVIKRDLSCYAFDTENRRWFKNGISNDPDAVIERVDIELAATTPRVAQ